MLKGLSPMEKYSDQIRKDFQKVQNGRFLGIFTYSSLAAGTLLFALTMMLDQTRNGVHVLKLFSHVLDIRMVCPVLWLLGIAGLYGLYVHMKGKGLTIVIFTAFLAMILCSALDAHAYVLILYIVIGILIIRARREGYLLKGLFHGFLIILYFALPLALLYADMVQSPYICKSFTVVADPKIDPDGEGYLYLTIGNLLKGTPLLGQSAYISQSGLALDQLINPYMYSYILIRIISSYGWIAGIGVLAALCLGSLVLLKVAFGIKTDAARCIPISSALFLLFQLVLSVSGNFVLLPYWLTCRLPFVSGYIPDVLCGLFLAAIVLWTGKVYRTSAGKDVK